MTVTEIGESYAPLQSAEIDGGEGRASSEESRREIPPGGKPESGWGAPVRGNGNEESWTEKSQNGNHRTPEELAPLKSFEIQGVRGDPENARALIGQQTMNKFEPPDGGSRAWSVMVASFFVNGIFFGVINSYSIIFSELKKRLEDSGDKNAAFKASLPGSLAIGTTFLFSAIAGILVDKIGIRTTTILGGGLAITGMLLSSLFCDKVEVLYLTYGIMYGVGASLAYTPSLVILGHYFKRRMGFVNGFATAGSSVFTVLLPLVMEPLMRRVGLENLLRCIACITVVVVACAFIFKPIMPPPAPTAEQARQRFNFAIKLKELINVSVWKRKRYVFWVLTVSLALFGYFVPYVHMGDIIKKTFPDDNKTLPIICIAITSGIGRLVFGFVADLPRVNRIFLQQIAFVSIGLLTMLLPIAGSYNVVLVIVLGMGLFDGCFITLLGPIAFDLCGQKDAAQAIGFLLGVCSIPLTAGPPIAGLMYDRMDSYNLALHLAGLPPVIGGIALTAIKFIKDKPLETESSNPLNQPSVQPGWQIDGKELQDMKKNGQSTKSP